MSIIEIEIKGKLCEEESKKLQIWLNTNTKFQGKENHKEIYLDRTIDSFFSDNGKGELDGTDFLRIRQSDTLSICLKKWREDNQGELTHCEEFTITVNDFDETLSLFKGLGYFPMVEIIKQRKVYQFGNFEIVLDDVKNLGNFFEVEWVGESIKPEDALMKIREFLIDTGMIGYHRLKRGYVSMLLNPNIDYKSYEKFKI